MTVHQGPAHFASGAAFSGREKDLLRFITCGSVDDGKSTLIGRLLFESKRLLDDQLAALEIESRKVGTQNGALDFALLVDGLSAEREQGITIDVAYRFFSTERRSFIVADTPGHEQYTRNMATGASTADVAILLVDARKGLTQQTRRHALLVSMLGIRHVLLAVNKMDLVGWSRSTFDGILADFRAFSAGLAFDDVTAIPISALGGDNVTSRSPAAPWYRGPSLLAYLEEVETETASLDQPFRMPVQWVNRPNLDFRGYAGMVTDGTIRRGTRVRVLPSGVETAVSRIVTYDGDLAEAVAGQSVTLTLADEVDVSRGNLIVAVDDPAKVADRIEARLFWMGATRLEQGRSYLLKLASQIAAATVTNVRARVDLETLSAEPAAGLQPNDIGDVTITLDRPIAFDPYAQSRDTGGFILIDRDSYATVGMGLIAGSAAPESARQAEAIEPSSVEPWLHAPVETLGRSGLKTVTWRVLGSAVTLVAAYALTDDVRLALSIGLCEIVLKTALYFGHERLWAGSRLGIAMAGPGRHPMPGPHAH